MSWRSPGPGAAQRACAGRRSTAEWDWPGATRGGDRQSVPAVGRHGGSGSARQRSISERVCGQARAWQQPEGPVRALTKPQHHPFYVLGTDLIRARGRQVMSQQCTPAWRRWPRAQVAVCGAARRTHAATKRSHPVCACAPHATAPSLVHLKRWCMTPGMRCQASKSGSKPRKAV